MHEMPVARDIIREALMQAIAHRGKKVTGLWVRLGPEGGYVADSLRAHIRAAATGTPAEDATVTIRCADSGGIVLESIEVEEAA